jgi:hypothetical protein
MATVEGKEARIEVGKAEIAPGAEKPEAIQMLVDPGGK